MTWSSAIGYWRGTRASWKARAYGRSPVSRRALSARRLNGAAALL